MRGRETSLLEGTETGEWREGGSGPEGFSVTKVTADLVLVFGCRQGRSQGGQGGQLPPLS